METPTLLIEAVAFVGTVFGIASKWLLGNKNPAGWVCSVFCAICWLIVAINLGSYVLIANNVIALVLTIRGCYMWRYK